MNSKDIYGDGHGFVDIPVSVATASRLNPRVIVNKPGPYSVLVYGTQGLLNAHHCTGTYDVRALAIEAMIGACSEPNVTRVEFIDHDQMHDYAYNYDLKQAPDDATPILGLYKLISPQALNGWVYHTRVIWRAKEPTSGYHYLSYDRSDVAHYVDDPIAWARTPTP